MFAKNHVKFKNIPSQLSLARLDLTCLHPLIDICMSCISDGSRRFHLAGTFFPPRRIMWSQFAAIPPVMWQACVIRGNLGGRVGPSPPLFLTAIYALLFTCFFFAFKFFLINEEPHRAGDRISFEIINFFILIMLGPFGPPKFIYNDLQQSKGFSSISYIKNYLKE